MNIIVKRAAQAVLCAGGLWAIGSAVASADAVSPPVAVAIAPANAATTATANSVDLPGNNTDGRTANVPADVPVAACGNSVGGGDAGCSPAHRNSTDSTHTTANAPADVPVTACGNTVGNGDAGCSPAGSTADGTSTGGNTANAPADVPITACGNTVGDGDAGCSPAGSTADGTSTGGRSANAPADVPVTACGNAVGDSTARCDSPAATTTEPTSPGPTTPNGGTTTVPVTGSVDVCVIGIRVLGSANANCARSTTPAAVVDVPAVDSGDPIDGDTAITPFAPPILGTDTTDGSSMSLTTNTASGQTLASTGVDAHKEILIGLALLLAGGLLTTSAIGRTS